MTNRRKWWVFPYMKYKIGEGYWEGDLVRAPKLWVSVAWYSPQPGDDHSTGYDSTRVVEATDGGPALMFMPSRRPHFGISREYGFTAFGLGGPLSFGIGWGKAAAETWNDWADSRALA